MEIPVEPLVGIKTELVAPPCEIQTLTALILGVLADEITIINNPLINDNILQLIEELKKINIYIENKETSLAVKGTRGVLNKSDEELNIPDSSIVLKYITALITNVHMGDTILNTTNPVIHKDLVRFVKLLNDIGVFGYFVKNTDHLPLKIKGGTLIGGPIDVQTENNYSNISPLLLVLPYAKMPSELSLVGETINKSYIDMTIDFMKQFGIEIENEQYKKFKITPKTSYKSAEINIKGDYYKSSYFFAAAAIHNGEIKITNLPKETIQGEKFFLDCLQEMGCEVIVEENAVTVKASTELKSVSVDASSYPELVPLLAVVSAFAKGTSEFTGLSFELKDHSNRYSDLAKQLKKMKIKTKISNDSLRIKGGKMRGKKIEFTTDSKVNLSFAIAGLKIPDIIVDDTEINKDFPEFMEIFRGL